MTAPLLAPSPAGSGEDDLFATSAVATRRRSSRPRVTVICSILWIAAVAGSSLLADLLPLPDPDVDVGHGVRLAPFRELAEPLGTDSLGRSILTRLIYGARVSLFAGIASVTIALALGLVFGVAAGYFRGKVDAAVGIIVDSILSFPGLVLLIALAATLQPGLSTVIIGLSVLAFPAFARLARANTLKCSNSEFVLASRGLGARRLTVVCREVVPIVFASLTTYAGVVAATLILAEASLSFLGLGVRPPRPSWGRMVAENTTFMLQSPSLVFVPGAVLFLTIFAINSIGEWLRSRSDLTSKL